MIIFIVHGKNVTALNNLTMRVTLPLPSLISVLPPHLNSLFPPSPKPQSQPQPQEHHRHIPPPSHFQNIKIILSVRHVVPIAAQDVPPI